MPYGTAVRPWERRLAAPLVKTWLAKGPARAPGPPGIARRQHEPGSKPPTRWATQEKPSYT